MKAFIHADIFSLCLKFEWDSKLLLEIQMDYTSITQVTLTGHVYA